MTDILGPANAAFAVTTRPAETRTFSALDSWFTDCTSASSADGTDVAAAFLNSFLANLRAVARANGNTAAGTPVVAEINSDTLLLAALQHMAQRGRGSYGVDSGAVNAAEVTLSPVPAEIFDGFRLRARMTQAPTASATLRLNGNDAFKAPVKRRGGLALVGGEWAVNDTMEFAYNAPLAAWQIIGLVASDVIAVVGATPSINAGRLINTQTFAAAGTYTYAPTPGTKSIVVTVLGGGGGGGGATNGTSSNFSIGGGGGGGGFAISKLLLTTAGVAGATITVGGGGAGSPNGNTTGATGGTSSFGSFLSATGGLGAGTSSAVAYAHVQTGGNGGGGLGGNLQNGVGQAGAISTGSSNGNYVSGSGGGSLGGYGAGLIASGQSGQLAGYNAVSPGGGGGGAVSAGGSGDAIGGAGMSGYVIIQEYS